MFMKGNLNFQELKNKDSEIAALIKKHNKILNQKDAYEKELIDNSSEINELYLELKSMRLQKDGFDLYKINTNLKINSLENDKPKLNQELHIINSRLGDLNIICSKLKKINQKISEENILLKNNNYFDSSSKIKDIESNLYFQTLKSQNVALENERKLMNPKND